MNFNIDETDLVNTYTNKAYGYRAIGICKNNGWLPLKATPSLAKIVGHLMGDGNLSKDAMAGQFNFYGSKGKLDSIAKILKDTFNVAPYFYDPHPMAMGECYFLRYNNCIFSRLLSLAGVPRGDKILQPFQVPVWIMLGSEQTKRAFLRAIFDDEMCRMYKTKKNKWAGLEFQLSKSKNYTPQLLFFLNQIRALLYQFKVSTNEPRIKQTSAFYRKDGNITYAARFRVSLKFENRSNFYHNIGFGDSEKQKLLYASLVKC